MDFLYFYKNLSDKYLLENISYYCFLKLNELILCIFLCFRIFYHIDNDQIGVKFVILRLNHNEN